MVKKNLADILDEWLTKDLHPILEKLFKELSTSKTRIKKLDYETNLD